MATSSRLTFLSYGLLLFNLILAGFAVLGMQGSSLPQNEGEVLGARSVPIFNPNLIISDETFSSTRALGSAGDVQNFLERANSPLKNYRENGQNASYWIFAAARGQTSSKGGVVPQLNPGLILAYLEKEQSLISAQSYDVYSDPQRKIRKAMGYGCPDTATCDSKYNGFVNQVNWGAYQLQYNFNIIQNNSKAAFPYNLNTTITTLDEYNVFLTNAATAANYRYTPHVYWGNYNLWKIIVANGWGVDPTKYSYQEIDAANLPNKGQKTQIQTNQATVSEEEGARLVRREYYLGQDNKDIERLQIFLRQKKFFMNRDITGLYGMVTDKALQNYRQENGIIIKEFSKMDKGLCIRLFNKDFQMNQQSDEIKDLQNCLMEIRYFEFPWTTSIFGPITRDGQLAARKAFNLDNSIPKEENKEVKNDQNIEQKEDNSCPSLKNQNFINGERSERVRNLQACMRQEGFFNFSGGNTGFFGPITLQALTNWKNGNRPSSPPPNNPPAQNSTFNCVDIKKQKWTMNERSSRVVALQACMRRDGVFNFAGGNTGFFGSVTRESLIKWRGFL